MEQVLETQEEIKAFEAFKKKYAVSNPPPVEPSLADWRGLGVLFWLKLMAVMAVTLLVALRTASAFYDAAYSYSGSEMFSSAEAILAVLGVEVFLVVISIENAKKHSARFTDTLSLVATILIVTISLIAAFSVSISGVDGISSAFKDNVNLLLAVLLSAATILAWLGGELIGGEIRDLNDAYVENMKAFKTLTEDWQRSLRTAWTSSDEYSIVRHEVRSVRKSLNRSLKDGVHSSSEQFIEQQPVHSLSAVYAQDVQQPFNERPKLPNEGQRSVSERIEQFIEQFIEQHSELPSVTAVQEGVQCSRGMAQKILKNYRGNNA